jgi:iron complex outermembrane recepter protein
MGVRLLSLRLAVTFRAAVANKNYWASALSGYLTEGAARTTKLSASVNF